MRLLHLVESVEAVGGVRTYLELLLPALERRGIESVVFTAEAGPSTFAGAARVHIPAVASTDARLGRADRDALAKAVRTAGVDACYSHTARSPAVVAAVARECPVMVYAHDYFTVCPGSALYLHRSNRFCSEGAGLRCFWRAYTERTTSRRPDRIANGYLRVRGWRHTWCDIAVVLVAAPFVGEVFAAEGVPRERIVVAPYFVEPVATSAGPRNVDVLYLGRLTASKGVHVLLRALAAVPGATAVVAGDGPERAALERLAARLGLATRARFAGWVTPEKRDRLLAASRLFVLPSLWDEAFGIAGLEALAAGVPVVASRVGGIPSWLEDGVCGRLVGRGSSGELAAAISGLLADEEHRCRLAAAAIEVAGRFSLERHLEALLPAIEHAVTSRVPAPAPSGRPGR